MGGNIGEIQIESERELYKYINHQAGTTKASTRIILVQRQVYNICRLLVGVPDYSSEVIEKNKIDSWLVDCFFFCVGAIDGAQQCSVLQVTSGDIDGIIHRHSGCAGFGFWLFSLFSCYVGCCIK